MPPFALIAADFVKTGGMDRANYALADYLARLGGDVHLVAHRVGEGLLRYPHVHWQRVPKPLGADALGWGPLARAGMARAQAVRAQGGRVLVNGGNCPAGDINWVHYVHAAYAPTVAGGWMRREVQAWKQRRCEADERAALPLASCVIANSEQTRQFLVQRLDLRPAAVHTVYYGCDAATFSPAAPGERAQLRAQWNWPAGGHTALFIGALGDRRKGFDTVLAAWRRLHAAGVRDLELAVAGAGREEPQWRATAQREGLPIRFLGFRRDIPLLLRACDLMVAPTRYEAYGLAVQEAVACGLPAIVSAAAGVSERLRPEMQALELHDPDSSLELETRVLAWRSQPAHFAALAARAGERLRQWSWDAMAAAILTAAGVKETRGDASRPALDVSSF